MVPARRQIRNSRSFPFKFLEFYGNNLRHPGMWRVHSFLRRVFPVDVDEEIAVERRGVSWILNPSDHVHKDVFWCGTKDCWDVHHILKFLKEGDTVLDIGANFGYYSVMLAHHLRKKCQVYAFEPDVLTFARLKEHVRINEMNDCIRPLSFAVSNTKGEALLSLRVVGNSGSASLVAADCSHQSTIQTISLDDFVREQNLGQVNFIKIDVEGAEPLVLMGGAKTILEQKPRMMVEFDSAVLRRAGSSVKELAQSLRDLGYSLSVAKRNMLVPFAGCAEDSLLVNIFCQPLHTDRPMQAS